MSDAKTNPEVEPDDRDTHHQQHAHEGSCGCGWKGTAERMRRAVEVECLGGANISADTVIEAVKDFERQAHDAVLAAVPPEVTSHLVQSQKELLKAGRRMVDLAMERLDAEAARAEDIHRAERERRAAARHQPPPAENPS